VSVTTGVRRLAAASCGLAAAAWALLVPLVAGRAEPAYSHLAQYISELGADGAAHALLVAAAGFAPLGALVIAFLALVAGLLPRPRQTRAGVACLMAVGAAYVASAVFPCDRGCPSEGSPSQTIHNAFGLLEYLGAIFGLLLLRGPLRADPRWERFAPFCSAAAALVVVGFVAMLLPPLAPFRGLAQRTAEAAIFGWIAAASLHLLRVSEASGRVAGAGVVIGVSRSATHTMAKPNATTIRLVTGHGVEGDAHAGATVKHRSRVARDPAQPNLRQVHLIHAELHDELRAGGFALVPGQMGENVTTRGVDLLGLPVDTRLRLGATAVVALTGLRNPCGQLDGIQPGLMAATLARDVGGGLVRKAGVMAVVVASGEVRPGDGIQVELPAKPHRRLEPV